MRKSGAKLPGPSDRQARGASLYTRHAVNDLTQNKGVTIALAVLLILSAFLMATGAMVMERLVGSVNQLFEEAKPPHFLQMHTGDYDREALERFAAERPEVEAWLIEEMLGFDGAVLAWDRPSTGESGDFSDSLIDNLFVSQNAEFDFLLDESGVIAQPESGQVYPPVAYQQRYDLQVGDVLRIGTGSGMHDLAIQGFVRDAQMASSLSSATRFLVSESDFQALERAGGGLEEIIVEYRLTDASLASDVSRAYSAEESLPKNGQAVTFGMIRMINAFSDGLVAVALVFVSLVLIMIALLSVRYVIRGTLEAEVREIGAMKAIGLPNKAITGLYLAKYSLLTVIACLIGGALAVPATGFLTRGVGVNYAQASAGPLTVLVPVLALTVVYLFVVGTCRGVLRGVRKVEVVGALVHGSTLDERRTARRAKRAARRVQRTSLAATRGTRINTRLAMLDLRAERGQWLLVPLVFFLAIVLMTLPMNLLSTFSSPRFVTYMGAADSDLRVDLLFSADVDDQRQEVLAQMQRDDRLTDIRSFANVLYQTHGEDGWEALRVEVGDYSSGTVEFLQGGRPEPGQIALSVLNAQEYHLAPGDEMKLRLDGQESVAVVSGIYQDVTSGGRTAKMHGQVEHGAAAYVLYADTVSGADPATLAAEYLGQFPAASVIPMQEYVQQTLAYVTDAFRSAAIVAFALALGVAALLATLFLSLHLTRERQKMGTLSAIGFSTGEIISQVRAKTLLAVVAGTAAGMVFAATAGESLVAGLISLAGLGIANLDFITNPLLVYLTYPLLLIGAGYLGAVALTARLRGADKSLWLT